MPLTRNRRSLIFLLLVGVLAAALVSLAILRRPPGAVSVPLSRMADLLKEGRVESLLVQKGRLAAVLKDGSRLQTGYEEPLTGLESLQVLGVEPQHLEGVRVEIGTAAGPVGSYLAATLLPLILLLGGLALLMRWASRSSGGLPTSLKAPARVVQEERPQVTFADVAGAAETKEELAEVVDFLRAPDRYSALGARIPKGVLMVGPPGCGKTLLGRAVAGEAAVPFFAISASEFIELFVGVGAARARDLFRRAREQAPSIIFIDELDAIGRHRGAGLGGGHDEREQTLNQILVELDGFEPRSRVVVMAATNRPDILDPALLRPGRFDRRVVVDLPDFQERLAILRLHSQGKPLAPDVELEAIARQTPGLSGADLENVLNEAAILAAREEALLIRSEHLMEGLEKALAGPQRRSLVMSPRERRLVAYHEAGHALVIAALKGMQRVVKVSIVSRGLALGYTQSLPEEHPYLLRCSQLEEDLAGLLGGRAAEELTFGELSTGAAQDLEACTHLARRMVTAFGMGDSLGPLSFGQQDGNVFLGKQLAEVRNYSEATAQTIDEEVRSLAQRAYERALDVLQGRREQLERLAQALLARESLHGPDLAALLA